MDEGGEDMNRNAGIEDGQQSNEFPIHAILMEQDKPAAYAHPKYARCIKFALCRNDSTLLINGVPTHLCQNDVFVLPAIGSFDRLCVAEHSDEPLAEYICIDPQGLLENIQPVYIDFKSLLLQDQKAFHYVFPQNEYPIISWLMQHILDEFRQKRENFRIMVSGMIVTLLIETIRGGGRTPGSIRFLTDEIREIYPAIRHLNYTNARDVSSEYLAALCHMNAARFRSRFRQIMGESLVEYITNQRLSRACEMLLYTDMPILTIAMDAGFETLSHFNKVFLSVLGETPSQWRKHFTSNLYTG